MALVLMAHAAQRSSVRQFQIALRTLQRLDVRFFVHRQHHCAVGWMRMRSRSMWATFGGKLRVGADTPAATPLQVNALTTQHSPDLMRRDVAQGLGHQHRAAPGGVSCRWRFVELRRIPFWVASS